MLDTLCLQAPALTGAAPAFAAGPVDWSMGFVPCGEWHTAGGAAACVLHLQQKQILLMSIRGWGLVLLACGGLWEQGLAELPGLQALAPRRGYDEVDLECRAILTRDRSSTVVRMPITDHRPHVLMGEGGGVTRPPTCDYSTPQRQDLT